MIRKFSPFPVLESERLLLRKLKPEDEAGIFDYQSNKENFPYVDMPVYKDQDEARKYILKMKNGVSNNEWIVWAICIKDIRSEDKSANLSEMLIGTISIWNLNLKENKAELGYGIFPKFRRQGYMKEALDLVTEYGFKSMKLSSIEAYTSHYNQPSKDFLTSMNFDFIHTIKDSYSEDNALMDIFDMKNPHFSIRIAKNKDIESLEYLIQKVLKESNAADYPKDVITFMCNYYSKETIRSKFDSKTTWVLEETEIEENLTSKVSMLGTISLCDDEIQALFVDSNTQGNGYGRQLLEVAEAYAKDAGVEALRLSASLTAKIFYEKMGYDHVELEDDPDFGQAYMMIKKM